MNNLEIYDNIFKRIFNADKQLLNANFEAGKVSNWDSVSQMALIGEVEDSFGIMLDIEDIIEFTSYEKGKNLLMKYDIEV